MGRAGQTPTAKQLANVAVARTYIRPAVRAAAHRTWHISVGHMVKDPTAAELAEIARVRASKAGG